MSILFFLLALSLLSRSRALPPAASPNPRNAPSNILEACRLSPYKTLCISTFNSDPKSRTAKLNELAVKALQHASKVANNNTIYVKEMLKKPDLEPMVEQYLTDCSEQYTDAAEQLDDSMAALLANAYSDVETWVNAAIADADSCENGFKLEPAKSVTLKAMNDLLRQVCRNAVAVTQVLASSG